ncbi:POP1 domain-containing protein/POPLD domain-containing protein [Cephalotus follicularis]|uniref:POP1 domain-containing protein/POPLD domain-containing protein n=1 Tax=Cephalotus follicularis TaxID=3775 RepID=A0A1Q3CSL8_CEPFO|nr:POP1 domain-containing protein/POPLD domain-containing protein [Cephalotus follicularis]
MSTGGSKKAQVSTDPPRKINVHKFVESRASELESLHSIVSNQVNNDFRSKRNKRRRTTSFNDRVAKKRHRKRQKLGVADKINALASDKDGEKVPRRIRRRIELRKNPSNGFCTSGDGTKRLRTHLWHAKRFKMTKLWGFYLPLGLQGRGRGSRALLRWFKHGVLVHDASYHVAIQLEGSEDSLMSVLQMVLVPSPSVQHEDTSRFVSSGAIYGSAMLHQVGGPHSQSIAPVIYMWRPFDQQTGEDDSHDHNAVEHNEPPRMGSNSSFRQVWVWIHISAYSEGYDALKFCCQKQTDEKGTVIKCFSREGQLAKLEVFGSKASQVLQKILKPFMCVSENFLEFKKCSVPEADGETQSRKSSIENEEHLPSDAILSLTVWDPRAVPKNMIGDVSMLALTRILEAEGKEHAASSGIFDKNNELQISSLSNSKGCNIFSDNKNLWDALFGVNPPLEENVICMQKQHQRMDFFCLDGPKSGMLKPSTEVQCARSCPIMLIRNNDQKGSHIGWSIILPLSWVKVFWISLVSNGVHAIGLREKHWIAGDVGLPYFPSDFPDCNAYSSFMSSEAAASHQEAEKRPLASRPFKVPIPPPWDSVRAAFDKRTTGEQENAISTEKDMADGNSSSDTTGNCAIPSFGHRHRLFREIFLRTSSALTDYMNETHSEQLVLFPQVPNSKTSFLKIMKDGSKISRGQNEISQIYYDHKICFIRVLLYAVKEGVFEEGAVVCAPHLNDISLLTSRSESIDSGFQIPQSSVRSYFKEQSSGKWELQIPEDPALRKSHRWPIGFVTTGFVRGSKKPAAEAFCEAVLLARLREEQWNEMPVMHQRKEIYVLVRNLRSSAYRLALATIVLEQQNEDVRYM